MLNDSVSLGDLAKPEIVFGALVGKLQEHAKNGDSLEKIAQELKGTDGGVLDAVMDCVRSAYVAMPRFTDGQLVKVGDYVDGLVGKVTGWSVDDAGRVTIHSADGDIQAAEFAKPIKLFDLYGVEFLPGEIVREVGTNKRCRVQRVNEFDVTVKIGDEVKTMKPDDLVHLEPDNQEKINSDAMLDMVDYWGCAGIKCGSCPSLMYGKTPAEYYLAPGCGTAKILDIIERERSLYEKMFAEINEKIEQEATEEQETTEETDAQC